MLFCAEGLVGRWELWLNKGRIFACPQRTGIQLLFGSSIQGSLHEPFSLSGALFPYMTWKLLPAQLSALGL